MNSSPRVSLRSARPGDEDQLAEVAFRSYRYPADSSFWVSYFRDHAHLSPRQIVVAEVNGVMAGHASMLSLTMSLCGEDVPVSGVAAVSVAPEFRRMGVADRLLKESLRRMRQNGDALSLLFAFRWSFYRKFGYGPCETWDLLRVHPRQLPESRHRRHVRALDRASHDADVRRIYEAARAGTTGQLARSDYWWTGRVYRRAPLGTVHVDPGTGRVDGYMLYDVPTSPPYPAQHLLVRELRGETPSAVQGLLGFLRAQADQYAMVELVLPRGEHAAWLDDYGLWDAPPSLCEHELAGLAMAGAMGRLVDVPAALQHHPGPRRNGARGSFGLDVEGGTGSRPLRLDVRLGARGMRAVPGTAERKRVSLGSDRLAQVYFRALSAMRLLDMGLASGSVDAAELLDAALGGPELHLGPMNAF
ncbi:MAG: GNAT family N-acetyltransferase [Deltaproteobacteria bacterium]|nr:GNAT family N-acetyltransferase [Deltaproteobacteria bacterium]